MAAILFFERQQFRQLWLWALLLSVAAFTVFGLLQAIKTADGNQLFGLLLPVIILAVTLTFFYLCRLETRISEHGISVRFYPIHIRFRFFPWAEIAQAYVRQYAPIAEYGGWGWRYRFSGKGMAYNVSGKYGIQLEFLNGSKLLIGTQNPESAKAALNQVFPQKPEA